MDSIFKTTLGMVICIMIIYCGMGVLYANNEAIAADNYLQAVRDTISAGNLQQRVIDSCEANANNNGYVLNTTRINDTNGYTTCIYIELEYNYTVGFLNYSGKHTKTTVAY